MNCFIINYHNDSYYYHYYYYCHFNYINKTGLYIFTGHIFNDVSRVTSILISIRPK